jgi:CelD/BcsL family acetyltransferase involved in cellulose biosynthesis
MAMKIRVFSFHRLPAEHLAAWSELQLASAECDSPFFRPEYHALAAEVGRPVMVGVMEEGDRPVGFLPFELGASCTGLPVSLKLSDFQGAIVAPGVAWSGHRLLKGCGLRTFHFDALLATQAPLLTGPVNVEPSHLADLSAGYEAYRAGLRARGETELERTLRKQAKLDHEVGPVRLCIEHADPAVIDRCLRWKIAQYERTGARNAFRDAWAVELVTRIARTQTPHFAGTVSVLYVADEPVAVHLGMRTATVLHYWFPAHDVTHRALRYSPGLILLAAMIEHFARTGIRRLDFGKGDYRHKREFGTGERWVAEGACGNSRLRTWLRTTAEGAGLAAPVRWYRQLRDGAVSS